MTSPPDLRFTLLEMRALHVRKVLMALVRLRASIGAEIGNLAAWTAIAADIAAALRGPRVVVKDVEAVCIWMGIEPDEATVAASAAKAARERRAPDFQMMPPKLIGANLGITDEEWLELRSTLNLRRMYVAPADGRTARRVQGRQAAANRRHAARAARGPSLAETKPWDALGIGRSSYFAKGFNVSVRTEMSSLPIEREERQKQSKLPGNDDKTVQRFPPEIDVGAPPMGNDDKTVQPPATTTKQSSVSSQLRRAR